MIRLIGCITALIFFAPAVIALSPTLANTEAGCEFSILESNYTGSSMPVGIINVDQDLSAIPQYLGTGGIVMPFPSIAPYALTIIGPACVRECTVGKNKEQTYDFERAIFEIASQQYNTTKASIQDITIKYVGPDTAEVTVSFEISNITPHSEDLFKCNREELSTGFIFLSDNVTSISDIHIDSTTAETKRGVWTYILPSETTGTVPYGKVSYFSGYGYNFHSPLDNKAHQLKFKIMSSNSEIKFSLFFPFESLELDKSIAIEPIQNYKEKHLISLDRPEIANRFIFPLKETYLTLNNSEKLEPDLKTIQTQSFAAVHIEVKQEPDIWFYLTKIRTIIGIFGILGTSVTIWINRKKIRQQWDKIKRTVRKK